VTHAFRRLQAQCGPDRATRDDAFGLFHAVVPVPDAGPDARWELLSIRDDVFVVITKCNYRRTRCEAVPAEPFLEFHFTIDGETTLSSRTRDKIAVRSSNLLVCRQGSDADYTVYCPPGPRCLVSVYVRPRFMREHLGLDAHGLPESARTLLEDEASDMTLHQLPLRLDVQNAIQQLLDAPFAGRQRLHFCAAKVMEVLCLCARDLAALPESERPPMAFTSRDLRLFERAREILSTQFCPQPTIAALARALGTNTSKLKTGFKMLYGTTIFEFRNHHRMMHAMALLASGDLPIGVVASRVGYHRQASFSLAFKTFFGKLPSEARRECAALPQMPVPLRAITSISHTPAGFARLATPTTDQAG
jgi:AraC-like DNA-binding protein